MKDITGDAYKYGVITAADSTTHTYTIDIDGTQNTYATAFSTNVKVRTDSVWTKQVLKVCVSFIVSKQYNFAYTYRGENQ